MHAHFLCALLASLYMQFYTVCMYDVETVQRSHHFLGSTHEQIYIHIRVHVYKYMEYCIHVCMYINTWSTVYTCACTRNSTSLRHELLLCAVLGNEQCVCVLAYHLQYMCLVVKVAGCNFHMHSLRVVPIIEEVPSLLV